MEKRLFVIKSTGAHQVGYALPDSTDKPWFEFTQMANILNALYWKWDYDPHSDAFRVINDDETSTWFYGFDFKTDEGIRHIYPFRDKNNALEAQELIEYMIN